MKKEFKRNQVFPILYLLSGILFGITTLLQFSTGSPVAILSMIASILFIINSIWSFSTPIISTDGIKIFFKEALFKQKEILISSIQRVEYPKRKLLKLYKKDGSVIKIRLDMIKSCDLVDFKNILRA